MNVVSKNCNYMLVRQHFSRRNFDQKLGLSFLNYGCMQRFIKMWGYKNSRFSEAPPWRGRAMHCNAMHACCCCFFLYMFSLISFFQVISALECSWLLIGCQLRDLYLYYYISIFSAEYLLTKYPFASHIWYLATYTICTTLTSAYIRRSESNCRSHMWIRINYERLLREVWI